jgi:hypothetical protein
MKADINSANTGEQEGGGEEFHEGKDEG